MAECTSAAQAGACSIYTVTEVQTPHPPMEDSLTQAKVWLSD